VPTAPEGTRIVNENPGAVAGADSGTHLGTNRKNIRDTRPVSPIARSLRPAIVLSRTAREWHR
jgi:hypothetical protein